jgi:hypothetical protein
MIFYHQSSLPKIKKYPTQITKFDNDIYPMFYLYWEYVNRILCIGPTSILFSKILELILTEILTQISSQIIRLLKGDKKMADNQPSGWAIGWTAFAAITMIIQGLWWLISGLVALFNSEFYVVTQNWIFQFDISTWGWIHLIVGIVVLIAGFALFSGAVWARTVGVIIAVLATLVSFAWLPYYPGWAFLFIAVSIAIIWALTVHGHDIAEA